MGGRTHSEGKALCIADFVVLFLVPSFFLIFGLSGGLFSAGRLRMFFPGVFFRWDLLGFPDKFSRDRSKLRPTFFHIVESFCRVFLGFSGVRRAQ